MKQVQPSRGSVLVVVLVLIAFAVLMLTQLVESGSPDLVLAVQRADRNRLQADAHAALETTLAVLMDFRTVDGALHAPAQGWGDPLAWADYRPREGVSLEVGFEDESGKLPLPAISLETLTAALGVAGLDPTEAARAADALFAWMHPGHIASDPAARAETYERAGQPFAPPFRSPRSFEELASVAVAGGCFFGPGGEPTRVLTAFKRLVSLYRFNAANLNAASPAALVAAGWDEARAAAFVRRRDGSGPGYFRTAPETGPPGGGWGTIIQALRINITARQGAAQLRLSALVTWDDQAVLPPPIMRETNKTGKTAVAVEKATLAEPERSDLRYPFKILELTESALPAPPRTHEPAA